MSLEVVHARSHFGEYPGLRFLERQGQLDPRGATVSPAPELGGQLGGIDLVAAADADLGHAWPCLLEEDGELLATNGVELVDSAVRLVGGGSAIAQPGLADRPPDEPVAELVVEALQDSPLHAERGGGPALEQTARDHHRVRPELDQLGGGA